MPDFSILPEEEEPLPRPVGDRAAAHIQPLLTPPSSADQTEATAGPIQTTPEPIATDLPPATTVEISATARSHSHSAGNVAPKGRTVVQAVAEARAAARAAGEKIGPAVSRAA